MSQRFRATMSSMVGGRVLELASADDRSEDGGLARNDQRSRQRVDEGRQRLPPRSEC